MLRLGGPVALQILAGLCVGATAWLMVARAPAVRPIALPMAAVALTAAEAFLVMRPALISFVLLAAALALVDDHRRRGGRRVWLLVPLQFAWSAVHGFATLGAALVAGYALYALACRVARGRFSSLLPEGEGRGATMAVAVAAVAASATCAGPVGPRLFLAPVKALEYGGLLSEWSPVTLRFALLHAPAFTLLAALAVAALLLGRDGERGSAPSLYDVALVTGTLVLALARTRLVPVFAIAAAPVVARRLAPLLLLSRLGPMLVAACGLAVAPAILLSAGSHLGIGFDEERLPEGAVRWIAEQKPKGPLWNFMSFGGWLSFRRYPEVRVFIDGRTSYLYPFEFFRDYLIAEHDPARFAELNRKWGFEWAVVAAGARDRFSEPIADDAAWALVHLDEVAAVYVRAAGPNAALARDAYRVMRHINEPAALLAAPPGPLAHDAALALRDQADSPRAHFVAAAASLAAGDRDRARRERDVVEALDPHYPGLPEIDERLR